MADARGLGYEPSDASVRKVLLVALAWVAFVGLAALALGALIGLFDIRQPPSEVSPLARAGIQTPEPRLAANPRTTLDEVRRREDALLHGYAWVDKGAGIARIPIERAIAILAERGWPDAGGQP